MHNHAVCLGMHTVTSTFATTCSTLEVCKLQNMYTKAMLLCTSRDVNAAVATLHIILKMQQHNLCRHLACLHGEPVVQWGILLNTSLGQARAWACMAADEHTGSR